ncbi:hypothetical protein VitviT2T_010519 [Vitis vinifera]|uniref:Reverse transcriptase domain-containing protein n=1 Tax=Vitis vinifera TaxID=29760 RepID=A0ABY9C807_VITVI|nr:hypothetical protein VitviT2T_010519 [Vitis vinifera]
MEGLDFNRIDGEDAACLEGVFTEAEVFFALSDLNGDKAPGPDGFSLSFWQFSWDFVKDEVMGFMKEFHEHDRFVRSLNSIFPVLANRIKKVVGKVVSSAQNAFVEGRQILDAALIANEAIDSLLKRNESGVLCKLDIEKVYDHLNWNFLLLVLQRMGFGEKWTGWISWCISTATFSVLINGTPTGFFNSSRGLRQGDPLSPYLFIIGMEAFSRLILRAVRGGFSFGLLDKRKKWRRGCGLRINLDKSEILPVGRVENLEALALEVGCKVGRLPNSYLGIPLGANHKSVAVWDGVEERFRRRLALWKRNYISKGGRITLIRSTLSSMPIYLMSLLRMPRVVSLRLEKIRRDFLWGEGALERKPHLVNWDSVCSDIRKGGLGVRRLSTLNRALLCKWNWRFANEREALWRQVISRKFGEEEGGWSMASSSDSWIKEYYEASKLADDINGMISQRISLPTSGSETQRHASAIRRKITILGTRLDSLQSLLLKLPGKQPITEKEMNRRKDMLSNLRSKVSQMASTLNMSNFANRDSLLGPEIKPADAMSRTTGLDNQGLVGLQRQIMKGKFKYLLQNDILVFFFLFQMSSIWIFMWVYAFEAEQDEGLDNLEETVISTKHIALAVNEELDLHTRLIVCFY